MLLMERYPGEMQITDDYRMSDWQAASHIYHATGVGVGPENYGLTQDEIMKITKEEGGFIKDVQRGNKLPSMEHVQAYQEAVKNICLNTEEKNIQ